MIEGYVGLIGGGKSLSATDRMMRYMASGGVVYTNMTLIRSPWYNLRYAHAMKEFKLPRIPRGVCRIVGGQYYMFDGELCLAKIKNGRAWANSCGFEAPKPTKMSLTCLVPAEVPSLFHSSLPSDLSPAAKSNVAPSPVRSPGFDPVAPR